MISTRLNEFEIFNEFETIKIIFKTVLRIVLRKGKTVSRNPYIYREDKRNM